MIKHIPYAASSQDSKQPVRILVVYTDTIYRFDGFYGIISAIYLTTFDIHYDTQFLKE